MKALILNLALYAVIGGAAHVAGRAITRRPLFNRRPFNCDACMSFWLTFTVGAPLTLFVPEVNGLSLLTIAFINYFYLITKITIND